MNSSLFSSAAGGFAAENNKLEDETGFGYCFVFNSLLSTTPLSSILSILSANTRCHTDKPLAKWFSRVVENSLSKVLGTVLQEMLPNISRRMPSIAYRWFTRASISDVKVLMRGSLSAVSPKHRDASQALKFQ